jgi:hypothetical protein
MPPEIERRSSMGSEAGAAGSRGRHKKRSRKAFAVGAVQGFNVYYRDTMLIAGGEHLLITKNNRRAHLGERGLAPVQAIHGNTITLDNGVQNRCVQAAAHSLGLHYDLASFPRVREPENVRLPAG